MHAKTILLLLLSFSLLLAVANEASGQQASITTELLSDSIGTYQLLEVGADLHKSYDNPYNPDQIAVEGVFTSPSGQIYKVPGFFYQNFDPRSWPYQPVATPLPWRVRFAPNEPGQWTYVIQAIDQSTGATATSNSEPTAFVCPPSGRHGFLRVAANNRYLEFSDGASFFGIGEDMSAFTGETPYCGANPPCEDDITPDQAVACHDGFCYSPYVISKYRQWIRDFGSHGGNLIRIWMTPTNFELEWGDAIGPTPAGTLGNYQQRQSRAYDLDEVFQLAAANNIFIDLIVMNPDELSIYPNPNPTSIQANIWAENPYRKELQLSDRKAFFTNTDAIQHFKNKLRYIQARWGQSPALFSYEIINEIDWVDNQAGNVFYPYSGAIKDWYGIMAAHLGTFYPAHPVNVSFAVGVNGGGPNDPNGLNSQPFIDLTNLHSYTRDKNGNYHRAYMTLNNIGKFKKPVFISEFGLSGCNVPDLTGFNLEVRNVVWSSAFSGAFSSAFYFGAEYKYAHSQWYSAEFYNNYKLLSLFMADETFNDPTNPFVPVGNALAVYDSYNPALGRDETPPDAPCFDKGGNYAPVSWSVDTGPAANTPAPINIRYLSKGITASITRGSKDDRLLEIFALKSPKRIIGWVHNKDYYWYNVPHSMDAGCDTDSTCHPITDTRNLPPNVPTLANKKMRISKLKYKGRYRIEWWNTQAQYGINNESINNGIIPKFTEYITTKKRRIDISIPTLQYPSDAAAPYAPDYAFKIIYEE